MLYINRVFVNHPSQGVETVDEFPTFKEADAMLNEYRMSDYSATYYISNRSTKAWRES